MEAGRKRMTILKECMFLRFLQKTRIKLTVIGRSMA